MVLFLLVLHYILHIRKNLDSLNLQENQGTITSVFSSEAPKSQSSFPFNKISIREDRKEKMDNNSNDANENVILASSKRPLPLQVHYEEVEEESIFRTKGNKIEEKTSRVY